MSFPTDRVVPSQSDVIKSLVDRSGHSWDSRRFRTELDEAFQSFDESGRRDLLRGLLDAARAEFGSGYDYSRGATCTAFFDWATTAARQLYPQPEREGVEVWLAVADRSRSAAFDADYHGSSPSDGGPLVPSQTHRAIAAFKVWQGTLAFLSEIDASKLDARVAERLGNTVESIRRSLNGAADQWRNGARQADQARTELPGGDGDAFSNQILIEPLVAGHGERTAPPQEVVDALPLVFSAVEAGRAQEL